MQTAFYKVIKNKNCTFVRSYIPNQEGLCNSYVVHFYMLECCFHLQDILNAHFVFNIGFPGFQTFHTSCIIRAKMHFKCFTSIVSLLPFMWNLCGLLTRNFICQIQIHERYFYWNGWRLVGKGNGNLFLRYSENYMEGVTHFGINCTSCIVLTIMWVLLNIDTMKILWQYDFEDTKLITVTLMKYICVHFSYILSSENDTLNWRSNKLK